MLTFEQGCSCVAHSLLVRLLTRGILPPANQGNKPVHRRRPLLNLVLAFEATQNPLQLVPLNARGGDQLRPCRHELSRTEFDHFTVEQCPPSLMRCVEQQEKPNLEPIAIFETRVLEQGAGDFHPALAIDGAFAVRESVQDLFRPLRSDQKRASGVLFFLRELSETGPRLPLLRGVQAPSAPCPIGTRGAVPQLYTGNFPRCPKRAESCNRKPGCFTQFLNSEIFVCHGFCCCSRLKRVHGSASASGEICYP